MEYDHDSFMLPLPSSEGRRAPQPKHGSRSRAALLSALTARQGRAASSRAAASLQSPPQCQLAAAAQRAQRAKTGTARLRRSAAAVRNGARPAPTQGLAALEAAIPAPAPAQRTTAALSSPAPQGLRHDVIPLVWDPKAPHKEGSVRTVVCLYAGAGIAGPLGAALIPEGVGDCAGSAGTDPAAAFCL